MRRWVTFIALVLVLGLLAACVESAEDESDDAADDSATTEESPTPEPTEEPTEEATEEPDPTPTEAPEPTEEATATPDAAETATPEQDETATEEPGDANGGEEHVISMLDNEFDPDELEISAGDTVTWVNEGGQIHTSTLDPEIAREPENAQLPDGAETWDSGDMETGDEFSVTLDVPGEYVYFCRPHEALGMVGTITVNEEE